MRILVITAAYPAPSEPERAAFIENLSLGLRRAEGVEAVVLAPRVSPGDPLDERRKGIRIRRFRYPSGGRRLKEMGSPAPLVVAAYFASASIAALRETARGAYDVILGHWVLPTGPAAAIASEVYRIPLVLVAHGSDIHRYAVRSATGGVLARFALRRAARVLATSREIRRILEARLGVPAALTGLLPMGVDEAIFGPPLDADGERRAARSRLGIKEADGVLLFVGDLVGEKGILDLVEVHRRLVEAGTGALLLVVGDGPLRGRLEAFRGPRMRIEGRVAQRDLLDRYRAADLLVLPSWGEGTPVTVLEALACGLPVVASRVGGIPDVVEDGVAGSLVDRGDLRGLERALARALPGEAGGEAEGWRRNILAARPRFAATDRAAELLATIGDVVGGRHG